MVFFFSDIKSFIKQLSNEMSKKMSLFNSFYNMSGACAKANVDVEKKVNNLKEMIGIKSRELDSKYNIIPGSIYEIKW